MSPETKLKLVGVGGIAVVLAVIGTAVVLNARASKPAAVTPSPSVSSSVAPTTVVTPINQGDQKVKIEDTVVGTGPAVKNGDKVTVHYTGTLTNGEKFDSSLDRNQPFSFVVGGGMVIQGWEEGLVGMQVGGKRKLTIPSEKGYGARGQGPIPPNSVLLFDIELISIG